MFSVKKVNIIFQNRRNDKSWHSSHRSLKCYMIPDVSMMECPFELQSSRFSSTTLCSSSHLPCNLRWLQYHVSHTHQYVFVFLLVSVPRLYSAVDLGFKPRLGQTKGYTIGSCCFSAQHAAWMRKSEEWLGRNQNNMFEWGDMYIHGLVSVSLHYRNSTMRVGLVQSGSLHHLIEN